jgi:hypothetical protein
MPVDMFFKIAESPWIRAGRQYSVRVSTFFHDFERIVFFHILHEHRIYGRIPTTELRYVTSQPTPFPLMAL